MKNSPLELIDVNGLHLLRMCILKDFKVFGDRKGNVLIDYSIHKEAYDVVAAFYKTNYKDYFDKETEPTGEEIKNLILSLIDLKIKK